jgi:hypothetical protein
MRVATFSRWFCHGLFVLFIILVSGCASFMKWNEGKNTMTSDCSGVDEISCNPLKTSSSFCCDGHQGWHCNPWATPKGEKLKGQCEYSGDDRTDPVPFCGGPLGCEGMKFMDAGRE